MSLKWKFWSNAIEIGTLKTIFIIILRSDAVKLK